MSVLRQLDELARRVVRDDPDICLAHLCAELCRASVGVGRYALPQPKARTTATPPAAPRVSKKARKPAQGKLF